MPDVTVGGLALQSANGLKADSAALADVSGTRVSGEARVCIS